jgi:hypothetical protein
LPLLPLLLPPPLLLLLLLLLSLLSVIRSSLSLGRGFCEAQGVKWRASGASS